MLLAILEDPPVTLVNPAALSLRVPTMAVDESITDSVWVQWRAAATPTFAEFE